jgi:polysaccharide pyruvyl transferase WcaK-like protein
MNLIHKAKHYYKRAWGMGHHPSLSSVLFSNKKVLVYYGFLGDNNYGDELVYNATKVLFTDAILLPVSRYTPPLLRLLVAIDIKKIIGVVIGGGTVVGNFNSAPVFEKMATAGKPVYMHGTGVKEVIVDQKAWKTVTQNEIFGGVRGPMSVKNMNQVKLGARVVGDAAFALFTDKKFIERNNNKRVLINLGTHVPYEGQEFFRKEFHDFIAYLINEDYIVSYLPFHEIDLELGLEIKKKFPEINMIPQPEGFDECADIFADCAFAIGERLHFTVVAIMTRTPFISINYAKKHEDLLLSLSISHLGLSPVDASKEKMLAAFNSRLSIEWNQISKNLEQYRELQNEQVQRYITKCKGVSKGA